MCLGDFLVLKKKKLSIIQGHMNQFHLTSGEQSNFTDSVKNESKTNMYVGVNICDPIERRQEYSQQQQELIFSWFLYRCGLIASF